MHMRTHNQNCKCNFCGKTFSRPWLLQGHLRTHTGNLFNKPIDFIEYFRFFCFIFCMTLNSISILLKEIIIIWQKISGERPYSCQICSKAFADKSNLRAHVQTHSSNKPYRCKHCGKTFALKSYLYKHEEAACLKNVAETHWRNFSNQLMIWYNKKFF